MRAEEGMVDQEQRIMECKYDVPKSKNISAEAKDLFSKLILADPAKRLHIYQIKQHKFFAGINWFDAAAGKLQPP